MNAFALPGFIMKALESLGVTATRSSEFCEFYGEGGGVMLIQKHEPCPHLTVPLPSISCVQRRFLNRQSKQTKIMRTASQPPQGKSHTLNMQEN